MRAERCIDPRGLHRFALILFFTVSMSTAAIARSDHASSPYAPFAFLIGDWDVGAESGKPVAIARLQWGPNQSYIWYSVSTVENGEEEPHFEGLLVWNGVRKRLDMLLVLDLNGGRAQEQGSVYVASDGTVVRDITAHYSEGSQPTGGPPVGPAGTSARFRQTFKAVGEDKLATALTRKTKTGWVPTFPGSDRLVMTRRPAKERSSGHGARSRVANVRAPSTHRGIGRALRRP
jgi:hypothetical protein